MHKPIDKRTQRGRELAARLNRQTVLDQMPKIYFVSDPSYSRYRVGRTDWPGDVFNLVSEEDFQVFKKVYQALLMPLLDYTDREEDDA